MERFSRTPHDAIFRQMLAQKEVARDFLQLYLPAQFLSICDLNTLPLVVTILFYHGTVSPWPHTLNWLQLYLNPLYAAGGIHGKARATHSRTGEAVARVQGANDDDCQMAGRERL